MDKLVDNFADQVNDDPFYHPQNAIIVPKKGRLSLLPERNFNCKLKFN